MTDTAPSKPIVRVAAGSSRMNDGLMNVITGAGTMADRTTANRYGIGYIDQYQIEAAYRTSGICKKIHDIPPKEMTRARRDWQAKPGDIEKLEAVEKQYKLWDRLQEAMLTARLFGGAAIILGLPGNSFTPAPRNPTTGSLRYITVVSRHQITVGPLDTDLNSVGFGEPLYYEMNSGNVIARIHPSRVIPIVSNPVPKGSMQTLGTDGFWGDPLLLSIESATKNVDSSQGNIAALLSEVKIDTITIPRLSDHLATREGENLIMNRVRVAQLFQSAFNTRLMDGGNGTDKEEWETRQLAFTGLPDVMRAFQVFLAGVVDIPYARLFGESPGGLNATGNSEQTDFNKMIRSKQNVELTPILDRVDAWLIPSALGRVPTDVYWEYGPLEDSNPETDAKIEKSDAETLKLYADSGVVPDTVIAAMARNRIVEGGHWPGSEVAYEEADAAGEVAPIADPDAEPDVVVAPEVGVSAVAANDGVRRTFDLTGADEDAELYARVRDMIADGQKATISVVKDAIPRPLYVSRPLLNVAEFTKWAKSQGFKSVSEELHVTVVYSKGAVDWMKMSEAWEGEKGEMTVAPGGPRIVEPLGDKGAIVLLFGSANLSWRNRSMIEAGATSDYPDYQPHVTITYDGSGVDLAKVEPYRGKLVFGPEVFEEIVDEWRPKEN